MHTREGINSSKLHSSAPNNLKHQSFLKEWDPLPQTVIALPAKYRQEKYQNRQENDPWRPATKQNPPRIERQENSINLAASRQESFTWRFGRQEK